MTDSRQRRSLGVTIMVADPLELDDLMTASPDEPALDATAADPPAVQQ